MGLLPAAKPAPAFPPEDGKWLLSMQPVVLWGLGQPKTWGGSAKPHPALPHPLLLSSPAAGSAWCWVWGRWGRTWWCWKKMRHLEPSAGCWLLTRRSPSPPAPGPSTAGRVTSWLQWWAIPEWLLSPWEMWPRASQVTEGLEIGCWKCGCHWGPAMSAGEHLHACAHLLARYRLWADSETLSGRGEHLLPFSFPSQLRTNSASSFLLSVYPSQQWQHRKIPRLERNSGNISSRIVLLYPWKMLIKSLHNSPQ